MYGIVKVLRSEYVLDDQVVGKAGDHDLGGVVGIGLGITARVSHGGIRSVRGHVQGIVRVLCARCCASRLPRKEAFQKAFFYRNFFATKSLRSFSVLQP